MTGWIVYQPEDVDKNKKFIQIVTETLKKQNINLRLLLLSQARKILENIHATMPEKITEIGSVRGKKKISETAQIIPDFIINRSRDAAMAEQAEREGIRVFNSAVVTRIANHKAETYRFLRNTVPFLPVKWNGTMVANGIGDTGVSYPYIIKSCRGHGGSQVFMVKDAEEEIKVLGALAGEDFLVQQCCSNPGKDVRVYIIGNEIICAVLRTSEKSFKSNFSLGGTAEQYQLNTEEKEMVYAVLEKISLDYAGIDFIFHEGKAVFNEIEDAVGARMVYESSALDIVALFAQYIAKEMQEKNNF